MTINENEPSWLLATESLNFFKGRGRGRNIFLTHDDSLYSFVKAKKSLELNKKLLGFVKELRSMADTPQITSNVVILPFSEEFLLKHFPDQSIQAAFDKVKNEWPHAKLLNAVDIAQTISFLSSPMSTAINGESLRACYGMDKAL